MSAPQVPQYQILIIDDDTELNALVKEYLARFGHHLRSAVTAADGLLEIRRERPDLIILDVMLPDTDGLTLCREIRQQFDTPIIMLTARGELADRVMGLELGADDYLAKPFEPRELVARLQSVIRRSVNLSENSHLVFDGLQLDAATRQVNLNGSNLHLTTMEFELLFLLMNSHGRALSRNWLIEHLRGIDADVYDRSVDMLVSRLREKLGDDSQTPRYIRTVRLTGYQFVGASRHE